MSVSHSGLWHYEYIPARGSEHAWRIGDEDDDPVTDFPTEDQARTLVKEHNRDVLARMAKHQDRWGT